VDAVEQKSFEERWCQVKRHLGRTNDKQPRPVFRFSLASFCIASATGGAIIGCLGRLDSPSFVDAICVAFMLTFSVGLGALVGSCTSQSTFEPPIEGHSQEDGFGGDASTPPAGERQ